MYLKTVPFFIFLFSLFFSFNIISADEIQTGTARFLFLNPPDNVIVKVDGKSINLDSTGWYTVNKGMRIIELTRSDTLLFSLSRKFSENEDKKFHFYCKEDCGGIEVNSVPSGANLSIDDEYTSTTPVTHHILAPGIHSLKLDMPGWETVHKDFEVTEQNISKMTFTLKRNINYREPVNLSRSQVKKTRKRITTAFLCIMTTSLASASAWFEYSAQQHLSNAKDASDLYDNAADGKFGIYKTEYYHSRKKAKDAIKIRNALTIATGVGLTGFFISLVF